VERIVSLFFYLRNADWEPTYNPGLQNMTLIEYANSTLLEANWMTRALVNKWTEPLHPEDLLVAKEILRRKCVVGLMSRWDESVERFNDYFNFKPPFERMKRNNANSTTQELHEELTEERFEMCMKIYDKGSNVRSHPKVEPDNEAFELLKSKNAWDMALYEFVQELFETQRITIEDLIKKRVEGDVITNTMVNHPELNVEIVEDEVRANKVEDHPELNVEMVEDKVNANTMEDQPELNIENYF